MFIKICGMTNADDALLAAGLGADAVGFIFAPSPRQVTPGRVRSIIERLPGSVLTVGVFRNEAKERVVDITNRTGIRAVQLHGNESPEETQWINERVPSVIRAVPAGSRAMVEHEAFGKVRFLIDAAQPGSGETFDWDILRQNRIDRDFILAGGLNPDNVVEAIQTVRPWGIDVASGVEKRPGIKDATKVNHFIVNARSVEEHHVNHALADPWDEPVV
ncbi:MAG: phosphoribosylanthranilate isomerase [Acidimicrobiales bacterium]